MPFVYLLFISVLYLKRTHSLSLPLFLILLLQEDVMVQSSLTLAVVRPSRASWASPTRDTQWVRRWAAQNQSLYLDVFVSFLRDAKLVLVYQVNDKGIKKKAKKKKKMLLSAGMVNNINVQIDNHCWKILNVSMSWSFILHLSCPFIQRSALWLVVPQPRGRRYTKGFANHFPSMKKPQLVLTNPVYNWSRLKMFQIWKMHVWSFLYSHKTQCKQRVYK